MVSRGSERVLTSDCRGAHRQDYGLQVHLWVRTTRTEASARASVLILHMRPATRQVCPADGGDVLGRSDGVTKILEILRNYLAPEAADAIRQQVMRYMRFRQTDQPVGEFPMEDDLARGQAEAKGEMGAGSPDHFASIFRVDNAALPRHEKSLVVATCHKSLRIEGASANLRRLFDSRGSGSRQDALLT